MPGVTVKEFFEGLEPKLNLKPEILSGMDCIYQFVVGDFAYNVLLKDGKAVVAKGEAPSPSCTVTISEKDFIDMLTGKLNGQMAFLSGRLKVAGDIGMAFKLGSFIS